MEPRSNIGYRCEKHKSHPDPAYFDKPFEFFIGKFCKLGFTSPTRQTELMWVLVEGVIEGSDGKKHLNGILKNDPIIVTDCECGDDVIFERHEIHAVLDV